MFIDPGQANGEEVNSAENASNEAAVTDTATEGTDAGEEE